MLTILLVEDDETIRFALQRFFQKKQVQTVCCDSVEKARSVLSPALSLALLDLNLPDGSGYTLCSIIKNVCDIPVIFLTVRDGEQDIVRGLDMGADDYIVKPFQLSVLWSRINAVLRRAAAGAGYAADRAGYAADRAGYAADRAGCAAGAGYAADKAGYAADRAGCAADRAGYAADRAGCAAAGAGHIMAGVRYAADSAKGDGLLCCGSIRADRAAGRVWAGEREVSLRAAEYRLLLLLLENKNRTLPRTLLLERLWDMGGDFVEDNTLTVTMKRLRESLGNPGCIRTLRGLGYRMEDTP